MKKLFAFALAAAFAVTAFAASSLSRINPNSGAGITLSADSSVVLSFLRSDGSAADYSSLIPSGYNLFGYYTLDAATNMITWGIIDMASMVNGTINIGNFSAGDTIAFWAANEAGEFFDSMHRDAEKATDRDSAYVDNNGQDPIITMGSISSNGFGSVKNLSSIDDATNYIFTVSTASVVLGPDPDSAPVGQPLPGVLAALVLGAGALGGGRLLRRKSK